MITKKQFLKSMQDLPNSFSVEEIIDRILLLQKIEIGIEESKSGKVNSDSESKIKLKKWLK